MSNKRIPFVIAVSPILSGFVENKNVDFMRSSRRIKRCKCQRKKNDGFLYTLGNSGVQAVDEDVNEKEGGFNYEYNLWLLQM